tara:strand:- start:56351 stop:57598 length:1248 start_codon:yes stop_codon:yes gene_type:complete
MKKKTLINYKFKIDNSIDHRDIRSVVKVMKSGVLSGFVASNNEFFRGGPQVRKFEKLWSKFFKSKYCISVNSWTSGLIACLGALDLEPGDEVITTPWTMCATATSILHWNCIPVFADIEKDTFCIDPKSVLKKISKKTKVILAVDIFGQSCDYESLLRISKKYNLKLICDSAQAILTKYKGKYVGTLGDVGGYSLNYHKHINTGEGGVIVTNNKKYAEKLYAIRNHAEAITKSHSVKELKNMVGYNFRMGEIEAAIGIQQLKKVKKRVQIKQNVVNKLNNGLKDLKGLKLPVIRKNTTHSFYIYPLILDLKALKMSRRKIFSALVKEGVQGLTDKYVLLHLYPIFQKKIAYGSKNFPWSTFKNKTTYRKGICPVAENLQNRTFLGLQIQLYDLKKKDIELIILAFKKVWREFGII